MIEPLTFSEILLIYAGWLIISIIPISRMPDENIEFLNFRIWTHILIIPVYILAIVVIPMALILAGIEWRWEHGGWQEKWDRMMNKSLDRVFFKEVPDVRSKKDDDFEWDF